MSAGDVLNVKPPRRHLSEVLLLQDIFGMTHQDLISFADFQKVTKRFWRHFYCVLVGHHNGRLVAAHSLVPGQRHLGDRVSLIAAECQKARLRVMHNLNK